MTNHHMDGFNIEGIVAELLSGFPFESPEACWEIHAQLGRHLEQALASKAAREARQAPPKTTS